MLGKKPFNKIEEQLILSAIKAAENNTSGEIRLHIEPRCKTDDTYERAIDLFEELLELADKSYVESIRKARKEYEQGDVFSLDEVFPDV